MSSGLLMGVKTRSSKMRTAAEVTGGFQVGPEKQLVFVQQLGTIIKERAYDEILYVDETTFNV